MQLNRKVLPLKDYRSYRALCAYYALMVGMKMLPGHQQYSLEEFFAIVEAMTPEDQLKVITNGAKLVALDEEEVKALVCFCTDKNGIPYTQENMKNLTPSEIVEVIVAVSMEILRNVKIDLLHTDEKKN